MLQSFVKKVVFIPLPQINFVCFDWSLRLTIELGRMEKIVLAFIDQNLETPQ